MLVSSTLVALIKANATRGAAVAQLVEQLIRNEQVTGSIPAIGSIKIARPEGLVIFMILSSANVFIAF